MIRSIFNKLITWKNESGRKPLLLRGVRQVGKTWLMKEFGKTCFKHLAYINCDSNEVIEELFAHDFDLDRIISMLGVAARVPMIPGETLIVLDEIQQVPRAVTALKYFQEEKPEYHVIAAGSLLGVGSLEGTGFPVGKVDFLNVYPMSFSEFLNASGQTGLVELLMHADWSEIKVFRQKLTEYLRYYYFTGGMPEAVAQFAKDRDFLRIRRIQEALLRAYSNDFGKHAPSDIVERIRMIWNAIPSQLAKENRKFVFSALRKGARSAVYEQAIGWLCNAGLSSMVYCASKPSMPLSAYRENAFKLFSVDVGLLGAQSGLDSQGIIGGNAIFEGFKGALTEQYVYQQLVAEYGLTPFYWADSASQCEVDFLYQYGGRIIPHEVKAEENLRARSLLSFARKHHIPLSVRTSMSDFRIDSISNNEQPLKLMNIPLYAIARLMKEINGKRGG